MRKQIEQTFDIELLLTSHLIYVVCMPFRIYFTDLHEKTQVVYYGIKRLTKNIGKET